HSGVFAADAVADVLTGRVDEPTAWARYQDRCRREFTASFFVGHALRAMVRTPMLDVIAMAYNSPTVRKAATWLVGSALAGSQVKDAGRPKNGASVAAPAFGAMVPPRASESHAAA